MKGDKGDTGAQGIAGRNGRDGADGHNGKDGVTTTVTQRQLDTATQAKVAKIAWLLLPPRRICKPPGSHYRQ